MIVHDNQPIQFNTPESQSCDTVGYIQLVNETDVSHFQIELDACDDAINLIVNGSFADTFLFGWINTSGKWSSQNGQACFAGNGTGDLSQDVLAVNTYYKMELDVVSIDNGGFIEVILGLHTIGFITTVGHHTLYGWTDDTNTMFTLEGNAVSGAGVGTICVDDISIFEVDLHVLIGLKDKDDNLISTRYLPDFITQIPAGVFNINEIDGDEFNLTDNYLTSFFDWTTEAIPAGCYQFEIVDNCLNTNGQIRVPNGEFSEPSFQLFGIPFPTDQPWVLTPSGTATIDITSGTLNYGDGVGFASATAVQTMLQVGNTYDYEINISSLSALTTVTLSYGTQSVLFNSIGVFSGSIISDGTDLTIAIVGDPANPSSANVEYIRHRVPDAELFFDLIGVDMKFGEHSETLLLNACNDANGFNFGFVGTGFSPTVRLHSKLCRAQFPIKRKTQRTSRGRSRVTFFDRTKTRNLKVEYHPEYILDFLSLMFGFDHFYIDLVEFVVAPDEEFFIEYGDQDTIGRVNFDVILKEEVMRNAACEPEGVGCALPPNFLLQENGDLVLGENGEFILVTG